MNYDQLKAEIERYGTHPVFGGSGELDAWIEQNPHELATFLVAMQDLGVTSILEIGTGWKGGFSRFLAAELGWDVTTVDVQNYGHAYPGVNYIIDAEKPTFDPEQFDLVLIDAKPTYPAAQENWSYYSEFARLAIAIHDIAGLRDCGGVTEFWHDVAYDDGLLPGAYEIIDDSDQRGGIGYVVLAEYEAQAEPVIEAAVPAEPEIQEVVKTTPKKAVKKPAAKSTAKPTKKAKSA